MIVFDFKVINGPFFTLRDEIFNFAAQVIPIRVVFSCFIFRTMQNPIPGPLVDFPALNDCFRTHIHSVDRTVYAQISNPIGQRRRNRGKGDAALHPVAVRCFIPGEKRLALLRGKRIEPCRNPLPERKLTEPFQQKIRQRRIGNLDFPDAESSRSRTEVDDAVEKLLEMFQFPVTEAKDDAFLVFPGKSPDIAISDIPADQVQNLAAVGGINLGKGRGRDIGASRFDVQPRGIPPHRFPDGRPLQGAREKPSIGWRLSPMIPLAFAHEKRMVRRRRKFRTADNPAFPNIVCLFFSGFQNSLKPSGMRDDQITGAQFGNASVSMTGQNHRLGGKAGRSSDKQVNVSGIILRFYFCEIPKIEDGSFGRQRGKLFDPALTLLPVFFVRGLGRVQWTQRPCRAPAVMQYRRWERFDLGDKRRFPSQRGPCLTGGFDAAADTSKSHMMSFLLIAAFTLPYHVSCTQSATFLGEIAGKKIGLLSLRKEVPQIEETILYFIEQKYLSAVENRIFDVIFNADNTNIEALGMARKVSDQLSTQQAKVLALICSFESEHRRVPSGRDLSRALKLAPSTIQHALTKLTALGYIRRPKPFAQFEILKREPDQQQEIPLHGVILNDLPLMFRQSIGTLRLESAPIKISNPAIFGLQVDQWPFTVSRPRVEANSIAIFQRKQIPCRGNIVLFFHNGALKLGQVRSTMPDIVLLEGSTLVRIEPNDQLCILAIYLTSFTKAETAYTMINH